MAATIFLCFGLSSPASCFPYDDELIKASNEVKAARDGLLALPVRPLETGVSHRAMASMLSMREAMEKLVITYLKQIPANSVANIKKIEKDLNYLIKSRRMIPGTSMPITVGSDRYGYEAWFEARITTDKRKLLQIQSAFSIACGEDSVLLIFQPEAKRWKEILKWQSRPYKDVSGALNVFQYAISPPDSQGKWYVLGADNPAHCASCWGGQRYYVLRPAESDTGPAISFKSWSTLYQCNEATELTANPGNFEIRFPGNSLQPEINVRPHIHHYELINGQFLRTQPVAKTPRDFVDEWIISPWKEASQWCIMVGCTDLKVEHERLHQINNKVRGFQFGEIRREPHRHNITQVELWDSTAPDSEPSWFFSVRRDHNKFTMLQIRRGK